MDELPRAAVEADLAMYQQGFSMTDLILELQNLRAVLIEEERPLLAKSVQTAIERLSDLVAIYVDAWEKTVWTTPEAAPDILAILAAPQPTTAAYAWQDIETAPRDGTRILARGGALDDTEIVSYSPNVGAWATSHYTLDDRDDEPDGYNRPRFWMPLPDGRTSQLPSTQSKTGEG